MMFLKGFVGFHERDKRSKLVRRKKSINLIDFVRVTARKHAAHAGATSPERAPVVCNRSTRATLDLRFLAGSRRSATAAFDPKWTVGFLYSGQSRVYSITLSALISSDCGILSPNALAVLLLMNNSNLVGCSIGRSAGLAPRRIFATSVLA